LKKYKWWGLAVILLLLVSAGGWWWLTSPHDAAGKDPAVACEIPLPTFTLSVSSENGMTEYLVLGMTVVVKGRAELPKGWLIKQNPEIKAAILSSLLNLSDIKKINNSALIRREVRSAVSMDMAHILPHGYQVVHVYITKLLVQ